MKPGTSAIVTVAFGHSTENLDYTFLSFAEKNPGIPLHAFILGTKLPARQLPQIKYHLIAPIPDFSHRLREVYFRRHELIDQLDAEFVLIVDSYDVLCLQLLPPFEKILAGFDVAAATEHMGSRCILGQGYTPNFLNGGVFFWNVPRSKDIRRDVLARARSHFRRVADDQQVLNEVIQTKHYERLRILPGQYNYRAYFGRKEAGWPDVEHLNGVMIYHNGPCIDLVKAAQLKPEARASLPELSTDPGPLREAAMLERSLQDLCELHVINESRAWIFKKFVICSVVRWLPKWSLKLLLPKWKQQIGL
jgi:hypothetical protein